MHAHLLALVALVASCTCLRPAALLLSPVRLNWFGASNGTVSKFPPLIEFFLQRVQALNANYVHEDLSRPPTWDKPVYTLAPSEAATAFQPAPQGDPATRKPPPTTTDAFEYEQLEETTEQFFELIEKNSTNANIRKQFPATQAIHKIRPLCSFTLLTSANMTPKVKGNISQPLQTVRWKTKSTKSRKLHCKNVENVKILVSIFKQPNPMGNKLNSIYCNLCDPKQIDVSTQCMQKLMQEEPVSKSCDQKKADHLHCMDDLHTKKHELTVEKFNKLVDELDAYLKARTPPLPCPNRETIMACLDDNPNASLNCRSQVEDFIICVDALRIQAVKQQIEDEQLAKKKRR